MRPGRGRRKILTGRETQEELREEFRPVIDRLRAHFGWRGCPVVRPDTPLGQFFAGEPAGSWERFAAAFPFSVSPGDCLRDVATRLRSA